MPTKADVKKILSKGLTGKEAGKLVFQDNWMVDTRRGGFLSEKDMASLKAGLKTDRDIKEYNSYVRLYKYVDYTLKEARIVALEAESFMNHILHLLNMYQMAEAVRLGFLYIPAIVTQKQYEELSAKQRALKLNSVMSLEEVISNISGVELEVILEEGEPQPVIDFQKDEKLIQAVELIKELLKSGKLKPLKLEKWDDYYDSHKLKIPAQPVKEVLEMLDKLLTGELQYDEDDSLRLTVFRLEDLYELEEMGSLVKSWIDTYMPNYGDETSARPADMMQSRYVAIIQNPKPEDLDERGYWIEQEYQSDKPRSDAKKVSEHITVFIEATKQRIKAYLAIKSVIEAISELIELDFLEDLEQWSRELHSVTDLLNVQIAKMEGRWDELGLTEQKPIKLGQLKASSASMRYFRERMALALGDNWWEGHSLKLEADEPDTLAQEFSEELEEELTKMGIRKDG